MYDVIKKMLYICNPYLQTTIKNVTTLIEKITTKRPSECTDIGEVRQEIDNIDKVIIRLLSERFEYVKEVVKYKDNTPESIEAPERRKAAIESRRQWAENVGLNPDVIENMYDSLIQYFISEEMKIKKI